MAQRPSPAEPQPQGAGGTGREVLDLGTKPRGEPMGHSPPLQEGAAPRQEAAGGWLGPECPGQSPAVHHSPGAQQTAMCCTVRGWRALSLNESS